MLSRTTHMAKSHPVPNIIMEEDIFMQHEYAHDGFMVLLSPGVKMSAKVRLIDRDIKGGRSYEEVFVSRPAAKDVFKEAIALAVDGKKYPDLVEFLQDEAKRLYGKKNAV